MNTLVCIHLICRKAGVLTHSQLAYLSLVSTGINQTEIAKALHVSPEGSIRSISHALLINGLIEKSREVCPSRMVIRLTPHGRKTISEIQKLLKP